MRKILLSTALLMSLTGVGARADDAASSARPDPAGGRAPPGQDVVAQAGTGQASPPGQQPPSETPPDQKPPNQAGQAQRYPGPITGGVFHQPTEAEINAREHETKAMERQGQEQNQEVEELYKQLIQPNGASK
jgi:hypothetical protein